MNTTDKQIYAHELGDAILLKLLADLKQDGYYHKDTQLTDGIALNAISIALVKLLASFVSQGYCEFDWVLDTIKNITTNVETEIKRQRSIG
jgi:hypothetical protein